MAKLIVKDRRLCIVNGRLVSDGDGAPCVCDGIPVCDDLTNLPGVCFRLSFEGIGINPDPYFGNPPGGTTYLTDTVVGANRAVALHSLSPVGLFREEPGLVLISWTGADPFEPNPFLFNNALTFFMAVECLGDDIIIRQVDVGTDTVGSGASIFSWQGSERLANGMLLANQIAGQDDPLGEMRFGQGGTVTINAARAPIGTCIAGAPQSHLAFKCSDPSVRIPVDIATRPSGLFGVRYQGENYRLSGQTSDLPPVPVDWTSQACPPPPADFGIAEKCDPFFPNAPDTVIYAVDPALGLGNGAVRLIVQYPNPACPERSCTAIIQYRPTATPTSGPATPGTAHLNGTACSLPTQVTCQACPGEPNPNDPIIRPSRPASTGDDMLDAMGFDPEEELRRVRAGGCCGGPGA